MSKCIERFMKNNRHLSVSWPNENMRRLLPCNDSILMLSNVFLFNSKLPIEYFSHLVHILLHCCLNHVNVNCLLNHIEQTNNDGLFLASMLNDSHTWLDGFFLSLTLCTIQIHIFFYSFWLKCLRPWHRLFWK